MTRFLVSGLRRDILVLIYSLEAPRDQELKRELEAHYETRVKPQEFYGALDRLVENGFVSKSADGVHDRFELTEAGERALLDHVEWIVDQVER